MPIPRAPLGDVTTSTAVAALFEQLHDELRDLVRSVDHETLNFVPCPEANSIATIVTHVLGSEAEALRSVAGLPVTRDRDAEFQHGTQSHASVFRQLDEADEIVAAVLPRLTAERLVTLTSLPTLDPDERRPGVTWLVGNLGHAREHVGHASLTKQLASG